MIPELETARLRLRPCRIEDEDLVHTLWTNEAIRRFLFDGRAISAEETHSLIAASDSSFESHGYGLRLVYELESDELIGFAGLLHSADGPPNLIYGIHPDFCGRGYATEAARSVLRYAFDELVLPEVKADVDEPNVASVRVLQKLGMKQVRRAVVNGRPLLYFSIELRS